jgi:C-terminal processing protease CtpA/Prc
MKTVAAFFLAILASGVSAEELPDLVPLSSGNFGKRQASQKAVNDWVIANHEVAREVLLKKYLKTDNPELRVRLIPLLERSYFKPKGYVGIIMSPELKDPNARPPGQGLQAREYHGVLITKVFSETPAELSGLKYEDIILKIDNWEVRGGSDLTSKVASQIQKNPPQTPIALQVKRGNKIISIELKLGILPTPSERVRDMPRTSFGDRSSSTFEVFEQMKEFKNWLDREIDKERKNLIADRRL